METLRAFLTPLLPFSLSASAIARRSRCRRHCGAGKGGPAQPAHRLADTFSRITAAARLGLTAISLGLLGTGSIAPAPGAPGVAGSRHLNH